VPDLLREEAAGPKQPRHEHLYRGLGRQTAVRMEIWKAARSRENRKWGLYDLNRDLIAQHNVAADHPEILLRLKEPDGLLPNLSGSRPS
jgi:hypothetical protein